MIRVLEKMRIPNIEKIIPSLNIPPILIKMLQSNPEFLNLCMMFLQKLMNPQEGGVRQTVDPNFKGKEPGVGAQNLQGGAK